MVHKKRVTRRKKRIRTKRARRQHGGTHDEEIRALVQHHFPEFSEGTRVKEGHVFLTCPASTDPNSDPNPDPNFIHFHITDNHMVLHYLRRCSEIRGKDILQRIIAIGRALSLDRIKLEDASLIRCDFPLYTLSMLQHGETWYNRMGFRSADYEENKKINEALREEKWEDFVYEMFYSHDARIGRDPKMTGTRIKNYLTKWYRAFPQTYGLTVAEVVNRINWKGIPCDHPHTSLLRDFLDMADSVLPYERYVILDLRPHSSLHTENA
jgi:hypothetical protein